MQVFAMIIVSLEEEQSTYFVIIMYLVEEPSIQAMIQLIITMTPI